ncbi:Rpn family recombination-promoting nuclease/putative transposase [Chlorogloeopsis sp. ULAP01]|uniref:Rpn family recombination-promoting nuclease/putative transposase n=1 Tax=Chlorogloeopsis sp. ULAP01 TaxID=3056483 RepID=UPI0025AAB024|nr:Rpn family recombination-promoting nuclease/putative transposase [Chlorogloeopsis sp. ULAP01]MDM9380823.1 Rpn family recombination-promoting nuclease/putative transposase [Chlorogloeopsis sp. ULAP01]
MKTDSIFYQIFQNFPGIFFELIGQPAVTGAIYEFISVEVKQTAFRIDGLFLPEPGLIEQPIYFLEIQFQKDNRLYQRLFAEIFLYFSRYDCGNDWRGVVIFKNKSLDPGVPLQYRGLLMSQQVQILYLDELGVEESLGVGVVKLVVENQKKAANFARQLLNKARQEIADELNRQRIIELIETIVLYKFPQMTRQELEAMFGFKELKQTRYFQEVAQEAREQGIQEGRQEGRQEGKLEAVPRLLALGLSVEQVAEALGLSVEQVQQKADEQTST